MVCTAEAAKCVVHLGRSYPREDPSCSGPVPTAKTTLNPAHVRPERRALHNEPRLDDTIKPLRMTIQALQSALDAEKQRLAEIRQERDRLYEAARSRRLWWPWRRSA